MDDIKIINLISRKQPFVLLTVLFACLFICSTAGAENNDNTIRIAVSSTPLSSPFIIAKDQGYFKEENLDVTFEYYKGGFKTIKAVFEGKADIATSSEAVVMFNSLKRNDFSLFCTFVTSDNDVKILAHNDSKIKTIEDLKGKKVGTIIGASAHFFLSYTLLMNGISEHEVDIQPLKLGNSATALEDTSLDAIVSWEPFVFLAQKKLGNKVNIVKHDKLYLETFNAITMRNYASKNNDKLSLIAKSLIKATKYIKSQPEKSQKIIARVLNKDLELIKKTWPDYSFSVSLNQWLLNTLESEAQWAIDHKYTTAEKVPNFIDFINSNPLHKAAPDNVHIFN